MKYKRCYNLLKTYGHSPTHALTIILDAQRNHKFAIKWVLLAFKARPAPEAKP